MKILIVEDDYAFQELARGIVMTVLCDPLDIIVVDNVPDALAAVDKSVDLVISDYDYAGGGFPALLPQISELNLDYVAMSSEMRKDVSPERFISKSVLIAGLRAKLKSLAA